MPLDLDHTLLDLFNRRRFAEAEALARDLTLRHPEHGFGWKVLGVLLKQRGHAAEALAPMRKATELAPEDAEAHNNLCAALKEQGRLAEAEASCRRALDLKPDLLLAHNNLGTILRGQGRLDEADASFHRALELKPDYVEALCHRADVLLELRRPQDALASVERALRLQPDLAEALNIRGIALKELKRFDEALASYDRALALRPDYPQALYNRGNLMKELRRAEDALACYEQAIALKPDYLAALNNRGIALQGLKQFDAALASYDQAIALHPGDPSAHWNSSICRLLMGDFARGWEGFEWRWEIENRGSARQRLYPEWNGRKLKGSLLILPEQGLGDQIFYSGMLNDCRARAESVVVCVDPRLVKLYRRSFDDMKIVAAGSLKPGMDFAAQAHMGSLGRYFRRSATDFRKVRVPYLHPAPSRVRELRSGISGKGKLICGLSWASTAANVGGDKSLRLPDLEPVLRLPGVDFVDLQYGDTAAEQKAFRAAAGIGLKRPGGIDNTSDIDSLAALIGACDVVVTVSNTTAHLAAALGKPTFVMLPYSVGLLWYWHTEGEDSPWYPNARLFRQSTSGDWNGVVRRVGKALARFRSP
jgi:tetratricopeptide (TPR) repeat protein